MITLRNLKQMVEDAETEAYELSFDATPKQCADMEDRAYDVWGLVLGYFGLTYFNPGEPEAYNDQFKVPLAGSNCDVYTYEEDELIIEGDELNNDLYWARLRLQQAAAISPPGPAFSKPGRNPEGPQHNKRSLSFWELSPCNGGL